MRETMAKEEECPHPQKPKSEDGEKSSTLFSPGFRSVAAMAGWDEEALLMASLVVEDTPDRNPEQKKRTGLLNSTTPSTKSRRKRRAQIRVTVLDLEEVECEKKETETTESGGTSDSKKGGNAESKAKEPSIPCSIDKLREELSCAICLEICFEPSTTPCGHSFCKKCLRSAADKCGKKCPKCRQLISNGRSCTVNTVLWNTIQLLFPQEVEARKASNGKVQQQSPARTHHHHHNSRNRRVGMLNNNNSPEAESEQQQHQSLGRANTSRSRVRRESGRPSRGDFVSVRSRRELPSQDEDSALALRLQREEFMAAFRDDSEEQEEQRRRTSSLAVARANLRAMASRAINIRTRSRGTY
ncbi:PREDICTED: E3 ubiquitin-protein ligase RNF169-like [Ipomoea nil]|uniref:E3 ubiquitin-protein ligase RNF169-like n=1 Tax=Ipomoea nil TaxID=35883 RepID=UPI0009009912|nr:PREDICTED: E3 ubiquitin-protein ligase RNF169-like [Ipomoea nil]